MFSIINIMKSHRRSSPRIIDFYSVQAALSCIIGRSESAGTESLLLRGKGAHTRARLQARSDPLLVRASRRRRPFCDWFRTDIVVLYCDCLKHFPLKRLVGGWPGSHQCTRVY